ncbi:MAG: heptosyltransferase [Chthoniobacter sp.]|jgi:heptosyltransferase-2|nr:heptosyltransferase [Chthoniobacter sp.]
MNRPRILVIRGGALGDFVLTLPAIKLLRENFPNAHLEILGYKHIIALAENRFYADAIRSIEYSALSRFFIPNADLAPDLMEYFGAFQQVISYLYDPDKFFETNLLRCGVKHFIHASPKLNDSGHAAVQLARPLERLALFLEDSAATLHPTESDREFASEFLGGAASPLIALHPGSGSEKKNWPVQHWLELGNWLLQLEPRPSVLLLGGEADQLALRLLSEAWKNERVLVAQHFPLFHVAALIEHARLFIGHDSGVSHVAAAVGAPCLLLFGATDPEVWAPANRHVRVLRAPDGNLANLPPGEVQMAVCEVLQ